MNRVQVNGMTIEYPPNIVVEIHGQNISIMVKTTSGTNLIDPASLPPDVISHVTHLGKTIYGRVRTDLTVKQARALDRFTFRKDGGYFIRYNPNQSNPQEQNPTIEQPVASETPVEAVQVDDEDDLPKNWKAIVFDVLREQGGRAFGRVISSRVYRTVPVTPPRYKNIRTALMSLVERGELGLVTKTRQAEYHLP